MAGFWLSPDGLHVAYEQSDESHIPNYRISHQGQADPARQEDHRYPFAGQANPLVRLGVANVASGHTVWLDLASSAGMPADDLYHIRVRRIMIGNLDWLRFTYVFRHRC